MSTTSLLEIVLDSASRFNPVEKQLEITVDRNVVPYSINDNVIAIEYNLSLGIHLLRVKLISNATFKISSFQLNKASIRSALHLSWVEHHGIKTNPNTCLEEIGQEWLLPFGNPMSHWLTLAYEKFTLRGPEYQHGQRLFDQCEVFYPESVDIGPEFPQIMQDFFKYDFNFTVIDKVSEYPRNLPYMPVDLGSAMDQAAEVYQEIVDNYDFLLSVQSTLPQNQYNLLENPDYVNHQWTAHHLRSIDKDTGELFWNSTLDRLPKLKKFIDSLGVVDPFYSFIGVTPAQSYIAPHVDSTFNFSEQFAPYIGCTQLYIPLTPNDKSLFKMAGVGIVPNRPTIIDNSDRIHSIVNNQNCLRVALAIRLDFEKNSKFYNKK